eukprot:243927_1
MEVQEKLQSEYHKLQQEIHKLRTKILLKRRESKVNSHKSYLRSEYDIRIEEEEENNKSTPLKANNEELPISSEEIDSNKQISLSAIKCKLSLQSKLEGHGNKVYGCDWSPINNNNIVSVGRDGKLIFWNADSGHKRLAYPLDTEFIMTLKYSPNAQFVSCG